MEHKIVIFKIDKDNVGSFTAVKWQRIVSATHVERFYNLLNKGQFMDSSILTVNSKNGIFYVINGNHRLEAIKQYLNNNPNAKIGVILHAYENINEDEELEVYKMLANERPQTTDDLLYIHRNQFKIYSMMKQSFPIRVSIYNDKSAVRLKQIVDGMFSAYVREDDISTIGFRIRTCPKNKIVDFVKGLTERDYKILTRFANIFVNTLGTAKDNQFVRSNAFIPLLSVFYANQHNVGDDTFLNLFKKVSHDPVILQSTPYNVSTELLNTVRDRIVYLSTSRGKTGLI